MAGKPRRKKKSARPDFCESQILTWADAFHARMGCWPCSASGLLAEHLSESWRNVDSALRYGFRGMPGGSSLAQFLAKHRQVRNLQQLPHLSIRKVLDWCDSYRELTGTWPNTKSGPIVEVPGETWRGIDHALRAGVRGLPGASSLAHLLTECRGYRDVQHLPRMSVRQILIWAEEHRRRTGVWPTRHSGSIPEAPGETWLGVDSALKLGRRRLTGGSSLVQLLAQRRGKRNRKRLPKLSIRRILTWARAHHRRTGHWPNTASGPIREAPGESWGAVNSALAVGYRGLPSGLTLAQVVGLRPEARAKAQRPLLSVSKILAWVDAHYRRTGAWPHARSGPVTESPGESWQRIDQALRANQRGLHCSMTLAQLLVEHRGLRSRAYPPSLNQKVILSWARQHRQRTGSWPSSLSGPIAGAPGETWRGVDQALRSGNRGLRGGSSLAVLLAQRAGARNRTNLPQLTADQILTWADDHHRRHGRWPTEKSGPIVAAPGETWNGVAMALRTGYRGLRGGLSLAQLLAQKRRVRNRASLPKLSPEQVVVWAKEHYQRTLTWPSKESGPVAGSPGETWRAIDSALALGHRGLSGGSSLARLLKSRT
jgi:hypothetical protein